jgi:hypothetical protein
MKILALEREQPGVTAQDVQPHLTAEALQAWKWYRIGVIREWYFRADRHTAVLVLECRDEHEARDILGTLPLVEAGLITFDILPLQPYDGFSRLFAEACAG